MRRKRMMLVLLIVTFVSAGCLMGIPIGYVVPEVYEKNVVPTPTVTPTPSTIFVPVDITIEELRGNETFTMQEYVSLHLATEPTHSVTRDRIDKSVLNKTLEPFEATVLSINLSEVKDECVILVQSDNYPMFRCVVTASPAWCETLGINSKVLTSGTITNITSDKGHWFVCELEDAGLSVR